MDTPLLPETRHGHRHGTDDAQAALPLAAAGVERHVWEGRYGPMLVEVRDGQVFVNGQWVQPAASLADPAAGR
jgi:hypothetical protein